MLKLLIEDSNGHVTVVPLVKDEISIGRGEGMNTIRLAEPEVSERHALIRVTERMVTIEDLDSDTGTRINGEKISGRTPMNLEDKIEIGNFQLQLTGEPQPEEPEEEGVHRQETTEKVALRALVREHGQSKVTAFDVTVDLTGPEIAGLKKMARQKGVSLDALVSLLLRMHLEKEK